MKIKLLTVRKCYENGRPIFRLSGYTTEKRKVSVKVKGYTNEVYFQVNEENFTDHDYETFLAFLHANRIVTEEPDERLVIKKSLYGLVDCYCFRVLVVSGRLYELSKNKLGEEPFFYIMLHDDFSDELKFLTERRISLFSWIDISGLEIDPGNIECDVRAITPTEDQSVQINQSVLYFDIECEDLKEDDSEIFQISIVCVRDGAMTIYLISRYDVDFFEVDGVPVIVEKVGSEKALIMKFILTINNEDPDIISGYNILEFDWKRILRTGEKYRMSEYFKLLAKDKSSYRVVNLSWESNAFAKTDYCYPSVDVRSQLDIIQYVKKNYRLASYSLNAVAKTFLSNEEKLDVDFRTIRIVSKLSRHIDDPDDETFSKWVTTARSYKFLPLLKNLSLDSKEDLRTELKDKLTYIGKYCVIDSILCYHLMEKLKITKACEELARLTYVSLEDVVSRGVQLRVLNLLYNFCRDESIVLNKPQGLYDSLNDVESYSGALVLDPVVGHHTGVVTLDFASLYPNIIQKYNLCYTTLIDHIDITSNEIKVENGIVDTGDEQFVFSNVEGILPRLCSHLMASRKEIKLQMKREVDVSILQTLDARQLALKVTANSIYGALGSTKGKRKCLPIAKCITAIGRSLLKTVMTLITGNGLTVIYGDTDSNIVKLPISISKPYIFYDTKKFRTHVEDRIGSASITGELLNTLTQEYAVDEFFVDEEGIDYSKTLERKVETVGKNLAAEVTSRINKLLSIEGNGFELEYENCFEHYLLLGRKHYVGRSYSGIYVKKGVMSVKRNYANIEKFIYDKVLALTFNNAEDKEGDLVRTILDVFARNSPYSVYNPEQYVISGQFKTLGSYALRRDVGLYIDERGNRFECDEKYDSRFYFERKPPVHANVAKKMAERGEDFEEYSRQEYVFIRKPSRTKGEKAIDFEYFQRNRHAFKIDILEYLRRLINPINKVLEFTDINFNEFSTFLIKYHKRIGVDLPKLGDLVEISTEVGGTMIRWNRSRVEAFFRAANLLDIGLLSDVNSLRKRIKDKLEEKASVSIAIKTYHQLENMAHQKVLPVIRENKLENQLWTYESCWKRNYQTYESACQTFNSSIVLRKLKKYRCKTVTPFERITDVFFQKRLVLEEMVKISTTKLWTPEKLVNSRRV